MIASIVRKVRVRGRFIIRKNTGGIKNIQALVFHGPEVERIHGHNHVNIKVVFQPESLFIPLHGLLQRFHGVIAKMLVALVNINP